MTRHESRTESLPILFEETAMPEAPVRVPISNPVFLRVRPPTPVMQTPAGSW
jgi:hypothetical protein